MKKEYIAPLLGQTIIFLTTAVLENTSGSKDIKNPDPIPGFQGVPARKLYV